MNTQLPVSLILIYKEYRKIVLLYVGITLAVIILVYINKFAFDAKFDLRFLGPFLFKGILGPLVIFFPYYLTKHGRYELPIIGLALVLPFVKISIWLHEKLYSFFSTKMSIEISSYEYLHGDVSVSSLYQLFVLAYFLLSLLFLPYLTYLTKKEKLFNPPVIFPLPPLS